MSEHLADTEDLTRDEVVALMLRLLNEVLAEEGIAGVVPDVSTPLIAGEAIVSSLSLASFVSDLEDAIVERTGRDDLTLVSEDALSRERSPFRNVDAFADYVMERLAR